MLAALAELSPLGLLVPGMDARSPRIYRLVCRVVEPGGVDTWEFIVWHRLDDTWKLTLARQLKKAD
jgi:hypothetical protein